MCLGPSSTLSAASASQPAPPSAMVPEFISLFPRFSLAALVAEISSLMSRSSPFLTSQQRKRRLRLPARERWADSSAQIKRIRLVRSCRLANCSTAAGVIAPVARILVVSCDLCLHTVIHTQSLSG